jgi:hypothetical protein
MIYSFNSGGINLFMSVDKIIITNFRKPYLWEDKETPCDVEKAVIGSWGWNRPVHKRASNLFQEK